MKKQSRYIFLAITLMLISVGQGLAKGPADVKKTWHNLSTSSPYLPYAPSQEDEICVFCHTPHGGSLDGPLWNRSLPAQGFTHYSSATVSTALSDSARDVNKESLLCLSCHDGVMAVNRVINPGNRNGNPADTDGDIPMVTRAFFPGMGVGPVIGDAPDASNTAQMLSKDLTDDHPISFKMATSFAQKPSSINDPAAIMAAYNSGAQSPRLFGGADYRVECSSCHDPHVDYITAGNEAYTPFLIMPNTGSAMCLACHNK